MNKTKLSEQIKDLIEQNQLIIIEKETALKNQERVSGDEVDVAQANQERSDLQLSIRKKETENKSLKQTLLRINLDSFGECDECGDDIEHARLFNNPCTVHCSSCAQYFYKKNQQLYRHAG